MAHNLNFRDGRASIMYVNEVPWHGLGTQLHEPATAQEAIEAAGLDWEVVKRPLYVVAGNGLEAISDRMAVVQRGKGKQADKVFGVVSPSYTPLQNRDAFAFFDSIVGRKSAIYHTAGALGDGEQIWVLAKLPESIRVAKCDDVEKYLLLSNSHDGSSSVHVKFTPIRVVCQNTLTMALETGRSVRVRHGRNLQAGLQHAKDLLGIVTKRYGLIERHFQDMARVKMASCRLVEYLRMVFPDPAPLEDGLLDLDDSARHDRQRSLRRAIDQVLLNRRESSRLFEEGKGNKIPTVRGTLWAAYNGIAEMVDYRQEGMNADRHLRSIWFGHGSRIKSRAYQIALEHMPGWMNG